MQAQPQNQYGSTPVLKPKYRLDRATRQGAGGNIVMSANGGETIVFEMVAKPFNLARSVLSFDLTIDEQADDFIQMFVNNLPVFRQIQFYGKNNVLMCDVTNLDVFTKIMANSDHSEKELRSKGETPLYPIGYDAGFSNPAFTGVLDNLTGELDDNAVALNVVTDPHITLASGVVNITPNPFIPNAQSRYEANASVFIPYDEQAYFISSRADDEAITHRFNIPLSYFKNTILAEDKDIVFSDITYIKLVLNSFTSVGFDSDDLAKANAGALEGDVTLSNIYLYQAMETNDEIVKMLEASLDQGNQELNFSWPECQTFNATTTSQNWYAKYGPGQGMRLQRIYWTCLPTGAEHNLRYATTNLNGAKIETLRTSIDNQLIQQYNIDCRDAGGNQDYMIMRELLDGGVCGNRNIYQYNWFWCEHFGPESRLIDHDNTLIAGKDISAKDLKYDVNLVTTNVPNTYYVFGITQRKLRITRIGIEIV